ncbi:hypothetical protein [Burkholderia sp. MSMB1826]|uniref:hypothetical protein n=1 Tax=Burkholderia sp. MSMB1826 TaxID=1637875 RepID=UPI000AE4D7FB|nr:hypothetical protein [Burkholderia sp. MSMB1826]
MKRKRFSIVQIVAVLKQSKWFSTPVKDIFDCPSLLVPPSPSVYFAAFAGFSLFDT